MTSSFLLPHNFWLHIFCKQVCRCVSSMYVLILNEMVKIVHDRCCCWSVGWLVCAPLEELNADSLSLMWRQIIWEGLSVELWTFCQHMFSCHCTNPTVARISPICSLVNKWYFTNPMVAPINQYLPSLDC